MRLTQQCGRNGSPRHNDRDFDLDKANHIDLEKTSSNLYSSYDESKTFKEGEIAYYKKHYSQALKISNDKKIAQRHPEKVRTIMDVYHSNRTKPEELILQIGNKDDNISRELFVKCFNQYMFELSNWNKQHGNPFHFLNISVHFDETSPHAHVRRVWDYVDDNGVRQISQNKALEKAGIERPDLSKSEGRYNNRKMTFDAMMREKWIDICEQNGLKIERDPIPGRKHKNVSEYKKSEIAKSYNDIQKFFENDNWNVMSNANNPPAQILQARNNLADNASALLKKNISKQEITQKQKSRSPQLQRQRRL